MWKYTTVKQCNDFLLSLHLINEQNPKFYLKKLYSISNNIGDNYNRFKIKKRSGKFRIINEPKATLKHIQRQILKNILNNKSISKYAKAYHKDVSLKDNATPHINKKIILKLDIENFFDNIYFMQVYNSCFEIEYFPKQVGMLLTYLCTLSDHLPQGAPTSSYISNLVMKEFDETIGFWCEERNISYTRYSDDMTFSGAFDIKEVVALVKKELSKYHFNLNKKKIVVIKKNNRQMVTGIVVNEKTQISKNTRDKIRQEIYYIKKYGIKNHLKYKNLDIPINKYLNKLYGRILYVLQINNNDSEFINYKNYIYKLKNDLN